jgi:VanZ family protein
MNNNSNNNKDNLITKIIAFSKYVASGYLVPKQAYEKLYKPFVNTSNDIFYIDGWTMLHLFFGLFSGYLYLYLKWNPKRFVITMLLICLVWELLEWHQGVVKLKMKGPDSLTDLIVDTLFFMLGAIVAYKNIRTIK